uniref:Serine/threonine protein phosphatase PrpC n=1 Tax=Candidatus Kentrum sp. LFY TaxID=2126342 RepID=A0A450WA66_9GAMM|nr:MAG: Serine/threonine protein phosphatase PrpC [Candidatus Kentron sp. LFY]
MPFWSPLRKRIMFPFRSFMRRNPAAPCRHDHVTISSRGGRSSNQDAHGTFGFGDSGMGWIVADGLGGHSGGEIASRTAVDTLSAYFRTPAGGGKEALSRQGLDSASRSAQSAIVARQRQQPQYSRMGTTVVILVSDGVTARWAHLGDSRIYRFRDGHVAAQSCDHSVPYRLYLAGEISQAEIRAHEERNLLLRSLGGEGGWGPDISEPVPLRPQDAFLLCSDGFWQYILEAEMEDDLSASTTARDWMDKMTARLRARVHGGHDNYTATAIRIRPGGTT